MNSIYFKNLNFQNRKLVHYTLLACIILLQIVVVVIWYNETANEDKLSKALTNVSNANEVGKLTSEMNSAIIASQKHFNTYIDTKNQTSLDDYLLSLNKTSLLIDSLRISTNNSEAFKKVLSKRNRTESEIKHIKASIDSIIDKQLYPTPLDVASPFQFNVLNYNKVLDSINTNTFIKVDSVSRKGLFSRLADAFSGKIEIQKEQLNTVITMKYKDKVKTGTLEEQMKYLITSSNKYYETEFKRLKNSFVNLRQKDSKLIQFNNQLLMLSQNVLPDFNNAANSFKSDSQKEFQNQYETNKKVRNYSIAALIFLMFVISLILFGFTRLAFEYEKRLTVAQEKISKSLSFKNRIIGMISHEIRSPLSIISIYSKKISASVKDEEVKETFKSIQFTTNSLQLLSNQILEYSKDENHKLELKNKNFYLKSELEQIITSMSSFVETKANKIMLQSNIKTDYEVYADVAKIHQLFYNIIGNANKFTENGKINVNINADSSSEYEVTLNIDIIDNGIGINEKELESIFEPYYQGSVSSDINNLGIGLGLNLCKEIIELFEGTITATSKENKGTKVTFNLVLSKV
ncbi:sensor histidine kinase [Flavobacterium dankookense]|uniref:histidine kinase n=1 Tax=Flavobacterium dankookense TaxID=706186 RepID=A0A4R6QHH7_9FLAO|nr:HAMP domain-containing sensor histidine kinase [Flavobacterium dankookense]TDP61039.1 signal transduction histidine kinase [Flavobacterium dankookense]